MAFLLSRCVGLVTPDPGAAAAFYQSQFEMVSFCTEVSLELAAGPLRLFIDPGRKRELVFELITDDLSEARQLVRQFGFEELVWRGAGQSCLVRDPFGLVINIHQDRSAFLPAPLEPPEPGFVKGCLGAQVPDPELTAEFYAKVLGSSVSRLADGSRIVDDGALRFRFRTGDSACPLIWLKSDAPVPDLVAAGCELHSSDLLLDPFGVAWCVEAASPAVRAVCCPL